MKDAKVKIFKDSVHGYIYVPEPYVRHLIDKEDENDDIRTEAG